MARRSSFLLGAAVALTASAGAARGDVVARVPDAPPQHHALPAEAASSPDDASLTIVLGGDVGLGGSRQPIDPEGAVRHGKRLGWADMTEKLAPLIDGDAAFANLETVVSDRRDLGVHPKAFNFRGHPNGLAHLVKSGFTVLSAANNHAIDYGEAGLLETIRHLEDMRGRGLRAWHGIGTSRDAALTPAALTVKGHRIAFAAVGIGGRDFSGSPSQRAGMLSVHTDFDDAVSRLASDTAALRILSVHYGAELQVRPSGGDERKLREGAATKGVDLVVGHHAHVAAGVQDIGGRLVFYGLGNLLHPGMQDMARMNICRDYGLLARVHLSPGSDGRLAVRAVEAVPLTEMHAAARPMEAADARQRIAVLNHLAAGLDDSESAAKGVRFSAQPDGRGLYCREGAADVPGRIGTLCRGWKAPEVEATDEARRAAYACGGSIATARARSASERTYRTAGAFPPPRRAKKSKSAWSWLGF